MGRPAVQNECKAVLGVEQCNCLASLVVIILLSCSEIINVDARQTSSETLLKTGEGGEPGSLFWIVF